MSAVRHHTVARFLLDRFAVETSRGARVCQLEIATGRPRQIGPRDAAIRKHFYSIDIDQGRSPVVEETLGQIETVAAPLIRRIASGDLPVHGQRAELALFISMTTLRTPLWREQTKSLIEQFLTFWFAETNRNKGLADVRKAFEGTAWETMTDEELEEMRDSLVDDLDSGGVTIEVPVNALIRFFLQQCTTMSWIVFGLEWTLVRAEGVLFILGDTPISRYDSTPPFPGSAPGFLSSDNAEFFIPLDPSFGILGRPDPAKRQALFDSAEVLPELVDEERAEVMAKLEGGWAETIAAQSVACELNLRTYAYAQRYVFGSQQAVCDAHRYAREHAARRIAVTPGPPRLHILEDNPERPGLMRASKVFEPRSSTKR
jgi:hypothetical protein